MHLSKCQLILNMQFNAKHFNDAVVEIKKDIINKEGVLRTRWKLTIRDLVGEAMRLR